MIHIDRATVADLVHLRKEYERWLTDDWHEDTDGTELLNEYYRILEAHIKDMRQYNELNFSIKALVEETDLDEDTIVDAVMLVCDGD